MCGVPTVFSRIQSPAPAAICADGHATLFCVVLMTSLYIYIYKTIFKKQFKKTNRYYELLNQSLNGQPHPDYYIAVMWQKLMVDGPAINTRINAVSKQAIFTMPTTTGDDAVGGNAVAAKAAADHVRIYAHCHNSDSSVAVVAINFDQFSAVNVALPSMYAAAEREDWVFTPCPEQGGVYGDCVKLNGVTLKTSTRTGMLPPMPPIIVSAEDDLTLPPHSYAFSLLPAPSGICSD